ncbi:hypothetical protein A3Q56_07414, partial [Intoshia linei]
MNEIKKQIIEKGLNMGNKWLQEENTKFAISAALTSLRMSIQLYGKLNIQLVYPYIILAGANIAQIIWIYIQNIDNFPIHMRCTMHLLIGKIEIER